MKPRKPTPRHYADPVSVAARNRTDLHRAGHVIGAAHKAAEKAGDKDRQRELLALGEWLRDGYRTESAA